MSQRAILLRNVAANYLGPLLSGAVNLVLVTLLVGHLGLERYGVLVLAMTFLAALALFDLGLNLATIRSVAECGARADWSALRETTTSYFGFAIIWGAAFGLLFLLSARPIALFFHVPADLEQAAVAVLRLTGLSLFLLFPQLALSAVIQGRQRYDLTNALTIVVALLRGILIAGTVWLGGGLVALAGVMAAIQFFALLMAVLLYRRALREVPLRFNWPRREVMKRLLSFGWATFLSDLMTVWLRNLDSLLVGRLISVAAVSPYTVAGKVPLALTTWVWQGPGVTFPWFAELKARDEREKMQNTLLIGLRLLLVPLVPLGSTLVVMAGPLLAVWVGKLFLPYAILLQVFAVLFVADGTRGVCVPALYGVGKPASVFRMCLFQFIASLALIFYWASKMQLLGVALAVSLPAILINWVVLLPYTCQTLGIQARDLFSRTLRSHLLPALIFWMMLSAAAPHIPARLVFVLATFLAAGLFYLALYGWLGMSAAERATVLTFARTRLRLSSTS